MRKRVERSLAACLAASLAVAPFLVTLVRDPALASRVLAALDDYFFPVAYALDDAHAEHLGVKAEKLTPPTRPEDRGRSKRAASRATKLSVFVYGERVDEPICMTVTSGPTAGNYWYHDNSIGTVVALTNDLGNVVESYSYTAYGELESVTNAGGQAVVDAQGKPQSAVGNPWLFQGRRYDAEEGSGLYYFRARYYSPSLGRFISGDPLGNWGDPSQLGNAQSAFGCNPVNRRDPFGLDESPDPAEAAIRAAKMAKDAAAEYKKLLDELHKEVHGQWRRVKDKSLWKDLTKGRPGLVQTDPETDPTDADAVTRAQTERCDDGSYRITVFLKPLVDAYRKIKKEGRAGDLRRLRKEILRDLIHEAGHVSDPLPPASESDNPRERYLRKTSRDIREHVRLRTLFEDLLRDWKADKTGLRARYADCGFVMNADEMSKIIEDIVYEIDLMRRGQSLARHTPE